MTATTIRPLALVTLALATLMGPKIHAEEPPVIRDGAISGEYLVLLEADVEIEQLEEAWQLLDPEFSAAVGGLGPILVTIDPAHAPEAVLALMRHTRGVEAADPNFVLQTLSPELPAEVTESGETEEAAEDELDHP